MSVYWLFLDVSIHLNIVGNLIRYFGEKMSDNSGIDAAIRELESEQQRIEQAIKILRSVRPQAKSDGARVRPREKRKLSAAGRKRISEAAKKRWAALRSKGKAKA
jgi:hypothetical protein